MNRILLGICAGSAVALTAAAAWTSGGTTADGALIPAFSHTFTEADDFDGYTIIDLDGQGGWQMEEGSDGEFIPCVKGTSGYYNVPSMNDWLITPKLWLEGGKAYRLTVNMSSQSNIAPERFEVKYGTAPTADGMTTAVIEPTEITNTEGYDFDGYLLPETSGEYFVGVHGMSDPNSWRLYCYSIKVGEATPTTAPGAVTALTVVPDPQWDMAATVKFTAPATDMAGAALTAPVDVDVWRAGVKLGTVSGCAPGSEQQFADNNTAAGAEMERPGTYEYTVIPRNASGEGFLAKASNYIGPNIPGDVTDIRLEETTPGTVKITWNAPTVDKDGNPVPADKVTYGLELLGWEEKVLATGYADTEYTVAVCKPTDQTFACVRIVAVTSAGYSTGVKSPIIPVGQPDAAPYLESFSEGRLSFLTGTEIVEQTGSGQPVAMTCIDADVPSVGSSDGDNGFAYGRMPSTGDKVAFFSGKIDLSALTAPKFALNIFKFSADHANTYTIQMRGVGGEYTDIATLSCADFTETGWHKTVTAIPAQFIGKTVQYRIVMENVNSFNCFLDRARIYDQADVNLAARTVNAPDAADVNEPFAISVLVDNLGELPAENYTVELLLNGVKVDEKAVAETLAPDASASVKFEQTLGVTAERFNNYSARVVIEGDEFAADNVAPEAKTELRVPSHPTVNDLNGTADQATGITLNWSAPDLAGGETEHVVMDFESLEDCATDLTPFTTHDGDGLASGTYTDDDIPGVTGEPAAWYVIDSSNENHGVEPGNNGSNKYAMVCYTEDDEAEVNKNDDWLITPELYGGKQTLSFYVRCRGSWYEESLEVLTSTTDNKPESFELYGELTVAEEEWTRIEVDVEDGVRYVAFRYTSEDMYFVAIDDIEYAPAGGNPLLQLQGYNVYRNGIRLNTDLLTEPTFTDADYEPDTDYTYAVTAVYNKGESALSNPVDLRVVALGTVEATESADTPAEYFNLAGVRVATGTVGAPKPALPAGIYLRRTAATTAKVVIR